MNYTLFFNEGILLIVEDLIFKSTIKKKTKVETIPIIMLLVVAAKMIDRDTSNDEIDNMGDISTLADPSVVKALVSNRIK